MFYHRFTVKDNKNWYLSYSPCGVFDIFVGLNKTGDKKPCVKASVSHLLSSTKGNHSCKSQLSTSKFQTSHYTVIDMQFNIYFVDQQILIAILVQQLLNYVSSYHSYRVNEQKMFLFLTVLFHIHVQHVANS